MDAKTLGCIYCHRTLDGKRHTDSMHPYVCDLCMEAIRTHVPLPVILQHPSTEPDGHRRSTKPPPQPGDGKARPRRTPKAGPTASALVALLLLVAGCAVNWSGRVELELDPTPLLTLQRPLAPALPAVPPPPP